MSLTFLGFLFFMISPTCFFNDLDSMFMSFPTRLTISKHVQVSPTFAVCLGISRICSNMFRVCPNMFRFVPTLSDFPQHVQILYGPIGPYGTLWAL